MMRQQVALPQNHPDDVQFLFNMAGSSVSELTGQAARYANYTLSPFTFTVTVSWFVCDLTPTLIYGKSVGSFLVEQLMKFMIIDSGLSAWLMMNFAIDISLETKIIQWFATAVFALMWLAVSLIPSIGKYVLRLYAMNGYPYADYYRQVLNLFDAVTDWPLAASVTWGGIAGVLGLYLNVNLLWIALWLIAGALTWFFSSKLESLMLSCWLTHFHLAKNSKVSRG